MDHFKQLALAKYPWLTTVSRFEFGGLEDNFLFLSRHFKIAQTILLLRPFL